MYVMLLNTTQCCHLWPVRARGPVRACGHVRTPICTDGLGNEAILVVRDLPKYASVVPATPLHLYSRIWWSSALLVLSQRSRSRITSRSGCALPVARSSACQQRHRRLGVLEGKHAWMREECVGSDASAYSGTEGLGDWRAPGARHQPEDACVIASRIGRVDIHACALLRRWADRVVPDAAYTACYRALRS